MYTGIIRGKFPVTHIQERPGLKTLSIEFTPELASGLKFGASVSISGVCLTVAKMDGNTILFDVMLETLNKTTLGSLKEGDEVNIERSAVYGAEIGGHPMSGHVHTVAEIIDVEEPENNKVVTFHVDPQWMKFIFSKGFIGIDGASLTVVDANREAGTFKIWLIPETLRITTFGKKGVGDKVNIEIDPQTQTIVETVERVLAQKDGKE